MQGYSLKWSNSAMKVALINQRTYVPYISIHTDEGTTTISQSAISSSAGKFKVDILGTLTGDVTEFNGVKVIYNSTHSYLGPASDLNSPAQQTIGDIQSSSEAKLKTASSSAFVFDPSIVSTINQDKSTQYFFKSPGLNNLNLFPRFPMSRNNQVWRFTNNRLESESANPGAIIFQLTTLEPITLTRIRTLVCPVVVYKQASGCFSCTIGAKVIYSIKSSCSAGTIGIESTGVTVNTKVLSITNTAKDYEISFSTGQSLNTVTLKFCGIEDCVTDTFSFIAVENITVRNDSTTNGTNVGGDGVSNGTYNGFSWDNMIGSLFGGLTSPLYPLYVFLFALMIIIPSIIVVVVIVYIVKMCSSKGETHQKVT